MKVFAQVPIESVFSPAQTFPTIGALVSVVIKNAFLFAGLLSFLLLIFGGFSIIVGAGAGDTKKLEQGRGAMVGAVTGLLIVVTSAWIVQVVQKLTGLDVLNFIQ